MKRLNLNDFKLKSLKKEKKRDTNQLLGQVLGNCHDPSPSDFVITVLYPINSDLPSYANDNNAQ